MVARTAVSAVGHFFTAYPAAVILIRYLFLHAGFDYPFFSTAVFSSFPFVAALGYYINRTIETPPEENPFFLNAAQTVAIVILHAGFHLLATYALFEPLVTVGVFLMIFQLETIFTMLFSVLILHRRTSWQQVCCSFLFVVAAGCFLLTKVVDGEVEFNEPTSDEAKAWGYVLGSCILYSLRGVLTSFFLLKQAYRIKASNPDKMAMAYDIHLFPDADSRGDMYLSRLDHIFDNVIFDSAFFGHTKRISFELNLVCGSLALLPTSLLVAFYNEETPTAFDLFFELDLEYTIVYAAISVAILLNIWARSSLVHSSGPFTYFCTSGAATFVSVMVGVVVLDEGDEGDNLNVMNVFALFVYAVGVVGYVQSVRWSKQKLQLTADIEILQAKLPELQESDVAGFRNLNNTLGHEAFQRIVVETLSSNDSKQWQKAAPATCEVRARFHDANYDELIDPAALGTVVGGGGGGEGGPLTVSEFPQLPLQPSEMADAEEKVNYLKHSRIATKSPGFDFTHEDDPDAFEEYGESLDVKGRR